METYHVQQDDDNHGYNGPLHVSLGGATSSLGQQFIETAKALYGWKTVVDSQDFQTVNTTSIWAKWINPRTGKRSDTAFGYVHPVREIQNNLHLLLGHKVVRILFEGNKAVGIEYIQKYSASKIS
jgi:alcohol oxidase